MNVNYHSETHTEDFTINIAEKGGCKGIVRIEVLVTENSVPLLVKDGSEQRIFGNSPPFVLQSFTHPITSGILKFEFSEIEALQDYKEAEQKAIVRYLYCE